MSLLHTPDSRTYIHHSCGSATVVSEEHFTMICDPFRLVTGTFCVACGNHFPLTEFVWADTGEVIADARKRWAEEAPPAVRTLNSATGCWLAFALGAAAGAAIGWVVGNGVGWKVGVGAGVGAIAVAILWVGVIVPLVTKQVYDWDPRRLK
jgi:hypothetical protein